MSHRGAVFVLVALVLYALPQLDDVFTARYWGWKLVLAWARWVCDRVGHDPQRDSFLENTPQCRRCLQFHDWKSGRWVRSIDELTDPPTIAAPRGTPHP